MLRLLNKDFSEVEERLYSTGNEEFNNLLEKTFFNSSQKSLVNYAKISLFSKRSRYEEEADDDLYDTSYEEPERRKFHSPLKKALIATGATLATAALTSPLWKDKAINKYNNFVGKDTKLNNTGYNNIIAKPGDIISASRMGGIYSHYGVVTQTDKSGKPLEIINYTNPTSLDPRHSVIAKSTLPEFGEGGKLTIEAPSGNFTRQQILARANEAANNNNNGQYSVVRNNCEHFARRVVNGVSESKQVNNNKIGRLINAGSNLINLLSSEKLKMTTKDFSNVQVQAPILLSDQAKLLFSKKGFDVRKNLTEDLGGMNFLNKNQTGIISAAGSVLGGLFGRINGKVRGKRLAKKYRIKRGTKRYDDLVAREKLKGTITGAGVGAGLGALSSKGIDYARGKVIADKSKYSKDLDLGTNYLDLGKTMRGIRSEEQIEKIADNWKELGGFAKGCIKAIY